MNLGKILGTIGGGLLGSGALGGLGVGGIGGMGAAGMGLGHLLHKLMGGGDDEQEGQPPQGPGQGPFGFHDMTGGIDSALARNTQMGQQQGPQWQFGKTPIGRLLGGIF